MTERGRFFRPHLAFSEGRRLSSDPGRRRLHASESDYRAARFRDQILPHLDSAYNFARFLSRDPSAAEDIVQTAFLRAFQGFDSFRGDAPKAWLFAIVRRSFLDWKSSRVEDCCEEAAEMLDREAALQADDDTPEQILARTQEDAALRRCISGLPEPFREALVMREFEDLSYKEIAAIAEVPIGTVMSRLARAREMLAELVLAQEGRRALS